MSFFRRLFGRSRPQTITTETAANPSIQIDGRRHRDDVPYALPKDLTEGERLNLQHYIFRFALKGNYAAPLEHTTSMILDVGSGTGIWGEEMAREFPTARVFGMDLEPPQTVSLSATVRQTPPNYHFVQGNVLQGLPFADHHFDYTHQRMLVLALPTQNWPGVLQELRRVTRLNGWVELLELSIPALNQGPVTTQLFRWATEFLSLRGIDPTQMSQVGSWMKQVGFRNIYYRPLDIPIGAWDKRLGILLEKDILAAFTAIKPGVCARLNVSPTLYDDHLAKIPHEWAQNRTSFRFHLAYGQV